ncbi:MAG TPA: hypothetical protein VIF12_06610 [Micavibrio sp.]|jgi:hypothetical protein
MKRTFNALAPKRGRADFDLGPDLFVEPGIGEAAIRNNDGGISDITTPKPPTKTPA